jgi:hypothetical protein
VTSTLRCPECGEAVSVWAGWCPACKAHLPQSAIDAPGYSDESQPAARSGSSRRVRWWVLAGAVLLVATVTIALLGGAADHPHRSQPPRTPAVFIPPADLPADMAGDVVAEVDRGQLRVFPLDGRRRILDVPTTTPLFPDRPLSLRNDTIVWLGGGRVLVAKNPLAGQVTDLGPADGVIAGPKPGQFWIVRGRPPAPVSVQLGCVSGSGVICGSELSPPVAVPDGLVPVGEAGGDLIVTGPPSAQTSPAMAWDPFSGDVKFYFRAPLRKTIDSHLNLLAWLGGSGGCAVDASVCAVHLTDVTTGVDHVIDPPPGYDSYIAGGAFSPEGNYLALFAIKLTTPQTARPVIVSLDAASTEMQVSAQSLPLGEAIGAAAWDPRGGGVFVSGVSGSLVVCRPVDPACVDLHLPWSYEFAVL